MHRQDKKHFLLSDEYTLKTERRLQQADKIRIFTPCEKAFYFLNYSLFILLLDLFLFIHIFYPLINMQMYVANMLL